MSADHKGRAAELRERYEALSRKVRADAETHGHHVSDLEESVWQWLDSLEIEVD